MDIQVGDRVTYKTFVRNKKIVITGIVTSNQIGFSSISWFRENLENKSIEIIKIERPHYEVVEEKKELLTEEEREFLKGFIKFNNNEETHTIRKVENYIFVHDFNYLTLANFKISNLRFKNLEEYKEYTIKELGLEEN